MMRVAVLGCGPAGLMAAQGAADSAVGAMEIRIWSRKSKSAMHGAQYLHRPIPGFTPGSGQEIKYELHGSPDDYRRKVYGMQFSGTVSPEDLGKTHLGWDIRATYDKLWQAWYPVIQDTWVTPHGILELREQWDPHIIISSLHRQHMCMMAHWFGSADIIAAGDAPSLGIMVPYPCPSNTVLCNGDPGVAWYRISNVFGHTTVEWPGAIKRAPLNSASTVRKPTKTNCDCHPDIRWVGRYGKWEKGVLSHTAYWDARRYVEDAASS